VIRNILYYFFRKTGHLFDPVFRISVVFLFTASMSSCAMGVEWGKANGFPSARQGSAFESFFDDNHATLFY